MHTTSLDAMRLFITKYLPDSELKILDLGSMVILPPQCEPPSYRELLTNKKWKYIGADIASGENVDVVLDDGYKFPFKDEEFDVVISGQTIEHLEFPWVWFIEVKRVLKTGGLCCIIAPQRTHEHRCPIDTFRYFPDGMRALCKWSGLEVVEVSKYGNDSYLIAKKITN
jgi:SAM-dependent methyltransferase